MSIKISKGFTDTEQYLSRLCKRTFLNMWCYTNPHKDDKKELCDVLAIFDNHIFIFFDRCKKLEFSTNDELQLQWNRWHKKVIEKQIKTCNGVERYLKSGRKIFFDKNLKDEIPFQVDKNKLIIHKIIIAHGAREACLKSSKDNINGSLCVTNKDPDIPLQAPFLLFIDSNNPVHVFDSHNFDIILSELDTFQDFTDYLVEKELLIKTSIPIIYTGEEELLAHYLNHYDKSTNSYYIKKEGYNGFFLDQGCWNKYIKSDRYLKRKEANEISYLWDGLINEIGTETFKNKNFIEANNAYYEMAKEPRFIRRALSEKIQNAMLTFPENDSYFYKKLTVLPSFNKNIQYAFLQIKFTDEKKKIYSNDLDDIRDYMLDIACGVTKIKYPETKKVIGIGILAPKYHLETSYKFLSCDFIAWDKEAEDHYIKENSDNECCRFFMSNNVKNGIFHVKDFPDD